MTFIKSLYQGKNKNHVGHRHRVHRTKKNRKKFTTDAGAVYKKKLEELKLKDYE